MSDVTEPAAAVQRELRGASDPGRENERRYLKSRREHLGTGMPFVDQVVRGVKKEDLSHEQFFIP